MKWLKLTVTTTTEGSDLVSSVLSDCGSEGVSINDYNDVLNLIKEHKNWDYIDDELAVCRDEKVYVCGYFPENFNLKEAEDALLKLKENSVFPMGSMETVCSFIDSEDWENEWRKFYFPVRTGKTVVVPAWQNYTCGNDEIPVYIEPGMAFGTGKHETTSMCIELLQQIKLADKSVVDVGCGSGILGAVALSLGAAKCVFNDIDEQAVKATESNLKLNKFENYKLITGDLDVGDEKYDVVLANLTADLLLRLKNKLSAVCNRGGKIIVSGIINARADEIFDAYCADLHNLCVLKRGEWQAMMFENL